MYITSLYYTITSITTVGYGDLRATSYLERTLGFVIMIIGCLVYTFYTGTLASVLVNYDQSTAKLQEKIVVLNRVFKEYMLPLELYE